MSIIPRSEYPRPQFMRQEWLCLNGEWKFEIDQGDSGLERGLLQRELSGRITVPFCPESELSGVHNRDFLNAVWYQRSVTIPEAWEGQCVLLHFQAVDYDTTVWVNQVEVGRHRGGFASFACDLTGVARPGQTVSIVVRARDSHKSVQPRGKQSQKFGSCSCFYTRTTGIWQTVWLEPVPWYSLRRPRITPDLTHSCIRVEQSLTRTRAGLSFHAEVYDTEGLVTSASCSADVDFVLYLDLHIPEARRRLWSLNDPYLYTLKLFLKDVDGSIIDQVESYAGLRSVTIDGKAVKLNGQTIFQRLVLDQGFYPDGIMTAPSEEALVRDITLSMEAGFNGARLHQKVFEERFLYHADRLGYMVWGEFGDWNAGGNGPEHDHQRPTAAYITEWLEVLERDYSHPSIVGWCPMNETWQPYTDQISALDDVTRGMFLATKAMDLTRPVLDASGYSHRVPESDIYDSHDYTQNVTTFRRRHSGLADGKPFVNAPRMRTRADKHNGKRTWSIPYRAQPYFVSEFGGIWWSPKAAEDEDSWGYGLRPHTIEEFYARFEGLCTALLDDPNMFGYCYTQLTDVYQEQNGIYTFDRRVKFDMARIRAIQQREAAIEALARTAADESFARRKVVLDEA